MKTSLKPFVLSVLEKAGCKSIRERSNDFTAQCPFHWPKKNFQCFSISHLEEDGGKYFCFSCKEKGNIFNLLMHLYQCSYKEAKKIFKKNVLISSINLQSIKEKFRKSQMFSLKMTSVTPIEFPPKSNPDPMLVYLHNRNDVKQHSIMDVNYVVSKYGLYYCDSGRYNQRIIMPIRQPDGTIVYFTNRSIVENRKKNIFPPDTHPTNFVYGLFEAMGSKKVLIFEGPFEVFQIKSFLIKKDLDYGCVSIMGTEMTEERSLLLTEFFEEAFIIFDGDEAGRNGSVKALKIMRDYMKVKNLTEFVYPGKDPAVCNEHQIMKILEHV